MPHEWHRDGFTVSTDPARLDLDMLHAFLSASYWARAIPRDVMERSIANAIPGVYEGARQVGFRRWFLLTRDAHGLYASLGFTPLAAPERWMEKWAPDAYGAGGIV